MARSLTVISLLFQSTTHCRYRVYTKFLLTYTAIYGRNRKVLPLGITAFQPQSHFHLGTPYIYYTPLHVSSTIVLIFRRTIVLTQHLVSSLSLGDCSVHGLREPSRKPCTEQSPKESDDTRCCTNTIVLLKMSTIVLETCRGMQ